WAKFHYIATWVFNVAYLNLLWILFSIIGLVFFGLFPVTAAMFAIVRKWVILDVRDFYIFTIFLFFYLYDFLIFLCFSFFYFLFYVSFFLFFFLTHLKCLLLYGSGLF